MKITGLKFLVEAAGLTAVNPGAGFGTGGAGQGQGTQTPSSVVGGAAGGKSAPKSSRFNFGNVTDIPSFLTAVGKSGVDAAKYAGAAIATPKGQLAAALSGRGSGLGWSKETAQQRFKHFRKELPDLVGSYAGMVGSALGQSANTGGPPTSGNILGRIANNPAVGKLTSTLGTVLKPLAGYASAGGDELAKIAAAATGDFRDASVLGTTETEIKKAPVQRVKIIP